MRTETVYLQRVDMVSEKVLATTEHVVWDKDRFLSAQKEACNKESEKGRPQYARLITRDEYRAATGWGKK